MRVLSIDIGIKNCAFYIEEFDDTKITKKTLYTEGKRCYWEVKNFSGEDIFLNIILYLDKQRPEWDKCSGIIIERQHKMNYNAQVVQHFIFSYFKQLYGSFKYISDISATRKTQVLGAPKHMTKPQRKKWAIGEAHKILDLRDDIEGLKILYSKKSDDLADTLVQLKAFQSLLFISGILP